MPISGQAKEKTILIIGKDKTYVNNISSRLKVNGYSTELCSSGLHAIQLIESSVENKKNYILIAISGDMEDMSGREILLLTRSIIKKEELPVLFLTSQDNDGEEISQLIEEGANDYIPSTDNFQKTLSKIQNLTSSAD